MEETFHPYDLHTHSLYSDGDRTPGALVALAREKGLAMLAVTDHDSVDGVREAVAAGREAGLAVIPAVEMDTEWPTELHMLGYGIDTENAALCAALAEITCRKIERNAEIFRLLRGLGMDAEPYVRCSLGRVTRLHIARALCEGGYTKTTAEAFERFLGRGRPAHANLVRFPPEKVMSLLRGAGGRCVLAHPCYLPGNEQAVVDQLMRWGLEGLEAYYPGSTPGKTRLFCSIAARGGLLVTAGSDFHGVNRPGNPLGGAWQPVPALEESYRFMLDLCQTGE